MKWWLIAIFALYCGVASGISYALGRKNGRREGNWNSLCVLSPHAEKITLSENGKAWLIDMDCIRLIVDRETMEVVGWYRPDVDPDVEEMRLTEKLRGLQRRST